MELAQFDISTMSIHYLIRQLQNKVSSFFQLAFEILAKYRNNSEVPILTIETRWISTSGGCVLCPGAYSGDVDHILTFELISSPFKTNFLEFANKASTLECEDALITKYNCSFNILPGPPCIPSGMAKCSLRVAEVLSE